MKTTIKVICVIAAVCIALIVTACGSGAEKKETTAESAAPTETVGEETSYYHADYLPDVNYDGYVYRIYAYDEYPADEPDITGNIISDAIYERNRLVEERYGITIKETRYPYASYGDVTNLLIKSGLSQSDDGDLYTVVFSGAYNAITQGCVPPASYLPVADLSQPWYLKSINDGMEIEGVTLVAYNAFDKNPGGKFLLFNKGIIENLSLDDPYSSVGSGSWIYDKLYGMSLDAISDLNGDGVMTEGDRFGMISAPDDITDLAYYGSGLKLVDFSSGSPVVSQNELLFDLFMKASNYVSTDGFMFDVMAAYGASADSPFKGVRLFESGGSLFIMAYTSTLPTLGNMEDDYGILPYPKASENQEKYYCGIDGSRIAVPSTASVDLERVCVIKEALAVESMNINYPAYYDVSIKDRYIRDEESLDMLEIITAGTTYDVGCALDYEAIRGPWLKTLNDGKTDFASSVAKNLPRAQKVLDKLIENIELIKTIYG